MIYILFVILYKLYFMKNHLNTVTDVYNKAKNFIVSGSGQFTTKVRNILKKVW